jgi:hypothetical protein
MLVSTCKSTLCYNPEDQHQLLFMMFKFRTTAGAVSGMMLLKQTVTNFTKFSSTSISSHHAKHFPQRGH